jgi:hypothetical protein
VQTVVVQLAQWSHPGAAVFVISKFFGVLLSNQFTIEQFASPGVSFHDRTRFIT